MKKPWHYELGGHRLEAFLGSRGMRTREISTTDELIQIAAGVFEIPLQATCQKMADAVAAIPKAERRALAQKNIGPSPHKRYGRRREKNSLGNMARELGVRPNELRAALKSLVNRSPRNH